MRPLLELRVVGIVLAEQRIFGGGDNLALGVADPDRVERTFAAQLGIVKNRLCFALHRLQVAGAVQVLFD